MNFILNGKLCTTIADVKNCASPKVANFIEEYLSDSDSVVAHTSGSTGEPKEIHLKKNDIKTSAKITNKFFNLDKNSLYYLCLSPDYIAGKMMIVRAIEAGGELIETNPSNEPLSTYTGDKRVSLVAVVPSQLGYLINHPEKLDNIDTLIIGGGKLSECIEYWLADKGVNAYKTYGMTETCSHVALSRVSRENLPYTAIGDITFSIDERNCLVINAPHLSTQRFVTNDVIELVDERNFYWKGRFDNVINTGGLKVYPEEVEKEIAKLLPKAKFYVTSIPSEKWGEEVVLVLEYSGIDDGERKEGEVRQDFVEKLKKVLPSYAIPKKYIAVKHFSMTKSGKIIRKLPK